MPDRGSIYSMNEANRPNWDPPLRAYVEDIQNGKGESGAMYTSRYIGSMVGDVHRTLLYGGIFGYPADGKNRNGKRPNSQPHPKPEPNPEPSPEPEPEPNPEPNQAKSGCCTRRRPWPTSSSRRANPHLTLSLTRIPRRAGGRPCDHGQDAHHGPGAAERAPADPGHPRLAGRCARVPQACSPCR